MSGERQRIGAELARAHNGSDPFAAAVRATRMPMIITDPRQADNPIVFSNDAFTRLTGYAREEILGRNCRFLQGPVTSREDVARIREAIGRRVPIELELQNYTKQGARFWNRLLVAPVFDEAGDLLYFFASQFDVTLERERLHDLKAALHRNEQLLDALIRSSSEVRYRINADWTSLSQLTGGDFIADTSEHNAGWLDDYIPPDDRPAVRAEIERAIRTKTIYSLEHRVYLVGGGIGWAASRAVPILDDDGAVSEWYGAAADITERKRAEAALRELNDNLEERVAQALAERSRVEDQLRQSQKMEAVGQLTGGVAHDFNNLLTVIRSSTDLLKRPDLTDERRSRYTAAISDTVDRAAKLTGQLLAFARRQALKPVAFDASEGMRGLADMMGTLTGSRIAVTMCLPEGACFVLADPSQFDTALVNMAVNARDAMDGAGRIAITVRPTDVIPAARLHPSRAGAFVAVSIADTGSGIPEDRLEQVFEPFFTTKAAGKGTGLGLSQVIGFAKQSGGDITVESTVGEGTTFTLYLPRVEAPEAAPVDDAPDAVIDGHGTRVLVVEDNADVGTFAVQTLNDLGYRTVLAIDGQAALAELAKDGEGFDVVFSDVVMAGMDGVELGQAIRRRYPGLPVVLTSGYSHVLAQNGTGGFELLHKPYSVEQLSRILRKVAAGKRGRTTVVG